MLTLNGFIMYTSIQDNQQKDRAIRGVFTGLDLSPLIEHLVDSIVERVVQRLNPPAVILEDKKMNVKEVADYYGVTADTVHSWASKGYLQKLRIAGRVYFAEHNVKSAARSLAKYKHQPNL